MIKIGILGCGKIAQVRHIPEYAANPDCQLVGFYNPTKSRAEDMAAKYGGLVYDTAEELLANPEIDAVSVCAANYAHAELAIQAMKAGKHVLCEKPMAITLSDCEEMVRVSEETGKFLMIGQNQRLTRAHMLAKQLLADGLIGRVITFRTSFGHGGPETWAIKPGKDTWFFDKSKAAMGAMADLGIHKTDLIQFLLGQKVVRSTARLATLDKRGADEQLIGVDDNAICIFEMADGPLQTYDVEQIQTNDNQTKSGVIDLWVDCLKNNRAPEISGESALYAMRAVFASIESSQTGKTVEIEANK